MERGPSIHGSQYRSRGCCSAVACQVASVGVLLPKGGGTLRFVCVCV